MDDLYAILRISPSASASEIESRLSSVSTYEAARIRAILLVEARRKAYDKAHQAMMRTSILRYALRVTNTANWPQSLQQRWLGDPVSAKERSTSSSDATNGVKTPVLEIWLIRARRYFWFAVTVAIILFLIFRCGTSQSRDEPASISSNDQTLERNAPTYSDPQTNSVATSEDLSDTLPRPKSGAVFKRRGKGVAVFKVIAPSQYDYYIKVVDPIRRVVVRSFFVRASYTEQIAVPLGTYHVYVNAGKHWYGPSRGFGSNSARTRLKSDFEFEQSDMGISIITVTLGTIRNGNLSSEGVDQSEFDQFE